MLTFWKVGGPFTRTMEELTPGLIPFGGADEAESDWHIYVYGTQGSTEETDAARETAERLAATGDQVDIVFPVVADTVVTGADMARGNLILLGNPKTNALLARMRDRLPVRFRGEEIVLGEQVFSEPDQLLVMIYPNPLRPDRYVKILGATTPGAFAGLRHIGQGTPDYSIVTPDGTVVAEGLFDISWRLNP